MASHFSALAHARDHRSVACLCALMFLVFSVCGLLGQVLFICSLCWLIQFRFFVRVRECVDDY